VTGRIKLMENLNDPIRNQTRDLLTCSAVPQILSESYCLSFPVAHVGIRLKTYVHTIKELTVSGNQ
jgi:hypothetical protein